MGNRARIEACTIFKSLIAQALSKEIQAIAPTTKNIVQLDDKGALENVIFLAHDAMRDKFEDMDLDNMCKYRSKQEFPLLFTIYSSATDRKLRLSRMLHEQNQLVDTQSLVHLKNRGNFSRFTRPIEVIDASGVDINMSPQHSYTYLYHKFMDDNIAKDIHNLLSLKKPAEDRCKIVGQGRRLLLVGHEDSPVFYAFN
ncbi:unnamed protein product [Sphagnum balticum]